MAKKTSKGAPRRRHHKGESMSAEARRIIDEGLARGTSYAVISDEIAAALGGPTGETISTSALGRYHAKKWRPKQDALVASQAAGDQLFRNMVRDNVAPPDVARAVATFAAQSLFPVMTIIADEKPAVLASLYANLEFARVEEAKVNAKHVELELKAKQLEHAKQLAEAKLASIRVELEKATKGGKQLTQEALTRTLRDVYGIARGASEKNSANAADESTMGGRSSSTGGTTGRDGGGVGAEIAGGSPEEARSQFPGGSDAAKSPSSTGAPPVAGGRSTG